MSQLSKNKLKYLKSLQQKKYRDFYKRFLIEGEKVIMEFLNSCHDHFKPVTLYALDNFCEVSLGLYSELEIIRISENDLNKISSFSSPQNAILEIEYTSLDTDLNPVLNKFSIYLESARDPGNLGTIIRTADWFGIDTVLCSKDSVEFYNPKVIQASMGSFARVNVIYIDFEELYERLRMQSDFTFIASYLKGSNFYNSDIPDKGILFFGNESKGLSKAIIDKCHLKLKIPDSVADQGPESLNLAISVGIFLSEISRRRFIQNAN